jgi:hypothetical protein
MPNKKRAGKVAGKNILARLGKSGESEIIVEREDEKIDVEIREIIRVKPQDFGALKNSFEEWAKTWE